MSTFRTQVREEIAFLLFFSFVAANPVDRVAEWTRNFREYFRGKGEQRMLGTYDDHDSGWNNGNRRNPAKQHFKEVSAIILQRRNIRAPCTNPNTHQTLQLILDFLDDPMDSNRRRSSNGLEYDVRISDDVHLWFLDERWYRDPLPCEIRRSWCTDTVLPNLSHNKHGWCTDYLIEGGCCNATQEVYLGACAGASQDEEVRSGEERNARVCVRRSDKATKCREYPGPRSEAKTSNNDVMEMSLFATRFARRCRFLVAST